MAFCPVPTALTSQAVHTTWMWTLDADKNVSGQNLEWASFRSQLVDGNTHLFSFCPALCDDADIRLVNGADEFEGRIEICFNETWGTICDGLWSTFDANVACRQLGFASTGS